MRVRPLMLVATLLGAGLAGALLAGCDCASGCAVETARLIDGAPTLDVSERIVLGAETPAVVRVRTLVDGVGAVGLVSGVERLRVLSPVRDTVDFGVGRPSTTAPTPVAFRAGETVTVAWRIAVDDLADRSLPTPTPTLRAYAVVDSVRLSDGRMVPATPDALCGVLPDACGDVLPSETSTAVRLTLTP